MFQPQPTPYSSFAYSSLPNYQYGQPTQQLGTEYSFVGSGGRNGGGLRVGGAEGSHDAFVGGASGARATGHLLAAGGPSNGASPLLFTNPAFNSDPDAGHLHHSSLNANTNANSNNHNFSPHARLGINNPRTSLRRRYRHATMDDVGVSADLAAQEEAAREYQPQLNGPAVGDRISSEAITQEYAKADPVYVQKTLALPQTYSHYRQILGDGNCGWRAIAFSYFEALTRLGNLGVLASERNRLANYPIIGHAEYIYEDFREEFLGLFDSMHSALESGHQDPIGLLVQKFNDDEVANAALYYLRLLTSSWLKSDPGAAEFAGFLAGDHGIEGYCNNNIDVPGREIEHLGITALYNLLLKETGMVLEIAYLDRSPGPEVTTYRFPSEADGQDPSTLGPLMCLLFRPDHYDVLYRHAAAAPAPSQPLDIQVNRAYIHSTDENKTATIAGFFDISFLPGLTTNPGLGVLDSFTPSPVPSWMSSPCASTLPIRQQQPQLQQDYQAPQEQEEHPVVHHGLPMAVMSPPLGGPTPPLRFSEYCHPQFQPMDSGDGWREPEFCTNTFKNSHFNTAHYNNPNFEPEQYQPDQDEMFHEIPTRHARQKRSR